MKKELKRKIEINDYYYSNQQKGIDRRTKDLVIKRCLPYIIGSQVLDLGFVDDLWTSYLLKKEYNVDIVEGLKQHIEFAEGLYKNNKNVRIFHELFENYKPDCKYNTIIAGDIIRYLYTPETFLQKASQWLEKDGRIIITVPNSRSLHRRIGCLMGMEKSPEDANKQDKKVGNLRSYDRYRLRQLLEEAGLCIETLHGCFLKPLSSLQIEDWSDELLQAFLDVGDELEDYCWFLYAVCKKND